MPAASFAHVLDQVIDAGAGPSSTAKTAGILTTPLFFFDMARAPRVAPTREARPPRPMNAVQRMAFELLNLAGASLATDFTNAELKGAFRRLARELHPDMHRNVTAERRTSLGMQFAEIREAYELLLKIRT